MNENPDQLDPAEALMREVGAQLRQVRLERGEQLDDVGQHLRIKPVYLLGIEEGNLSAMPGRTYALGFLRSYADYLGFDGDDLITQIKSTVANLTDKTRLRIRTPLPESRLPKTPILVLSLAVVAGIYTGWSYVNRGSQLVIETVAEVPANLRNLAFGNLREDGEPSPPRPAAGSGPPAQETRAAMARPAPPPAAGSDPVGAAPASGPPAAERGSGAGTGAALRAWPRRRRPGARSGAPDRGGGAGGAPRERAGHGGARPSAAARDAAFSRTRTAGRNQPPGPMLWHSRPCPRRRPRPRTSPPPPPPPPMASSRGGRAPRPARRLAADPATGGPPGQIVEPDNTDARVVIRALESSWIEISSAAGDYLRDRTLEPNDVFLVPNRSDLELWTGNAGGLQVIVDGVVLAPLGTSGAVVRDVALDPSSLRLRFGRPHAR